MKEQRLLLFLLSLTYRGFEKKRNCFKGSQCVASKGCFRTIRCRLESWTKNGVFSSRVRINQSACADWSYDFAVGYYRLAAESVLGI